MAVSVESIRLNYEFTEPEWEIWESELSDTIRNDFEKRMESEFNVREFVDEANLRAVSFEVLVVGPFDPGPYMEDLIEQCGKRFRDVLTQMVRNWRAHGKARTK